LKNIFSTFFNSIKYFQIVYNPKKNNLIHSLNNLSGENVYKAKLHQYFQQEENKFLGELEL